MKLTILLSVEMRHELYVQLAKVADPNMSETIRHLLGKSLDDPRPLPQEGERSKTRYGKVKCQLQISPELYERLETLAASLDLGRSETVRRLLIKVIDDPPVMPESR